MQPVSMIWISSWMPFFASSSTSTSLTLFSPLVIQAPPAQINSGFRIIAFSRLPFRLDVPPFDDQFRDDLTALDVLADDSAGIRIIDVSIDDTGLVFHRYFDSRFPVAQTHAARLHYLDIMDVGFLQFLNDGHESVLGSCSNSTRTHGNDNLAPFLSLAKVHGLQGLLFDALQFFQ